MPDYKFSYTEYDNMDELSMEQQRLVESARNSCLSAYAPYSNFKVGCAVLLSNGETIVGSNVENASYPVGICAERTVLSNVVSNFPNEQIIAMAITYVAKKDIGELAFPCGMCRQFILECQSRNKKPIELIMVSQKDKVVIIKDATHLLPFGFTGEFL